MCSFYLPPNFSLFSYEEVFKLPTFYPLYSIILTFNVLKAILKHANMLKNYVLDQKSPCKQPEILNLIVDQYFYSCLIIVK